MMFRALIPVQEMIYFKAMCYKNTHSYVKASRDYKSLEVPLYQNQNKDLIKYLVGILLLPL